MSKIYIGTSGWVYSHWEKIFYPEDLAPKDKLKYFSQQFKTTEVNYSFYRLPSPVTYQNWHSQTPVDFLFALKASRFITHIKRLKGVKEAWKVFIKNALNLKEKLGPILFQFPPSFRADEKNIKRLERLLKLIKGFKCNPTGTPTLPPPSPTFVRAPSLSPRSIQQVSSFKIRYAFEFRHKTWCQEKIYKILKKYKVAWVIADSPGCPKAEEVTANFVYVRLHGSKVLFSSKYTKKELKELSQKIKKWLKQGKDVFVYFNNDAYGYAVENAKTLKGLLAA